MKGFHTPLRRSLCTLALITLLMASYGCKKKAANEGEDRTPDSTETADVDQTDAFRNRVKGMTGIIEPVQDLNEDQVALGERLYHDPNLSADGTISCASCHKVDAGGVDGEPTSPGVGGKRGDVNSPTVLNSHLNFVQFWDGRAATLEEQALGPIENPVEMANTLDHVVAYLKSEPSYVEAFQKAFDGKEIDPETVSSALGVYERTLSTPNDKFDQWLQGDDDALTDTEKSGLQAFIDLGCTSCHNGPGLGGRSYQKMGLVKDYFGTLDRDLAEADNGRFNVTQNENDRHAFKVPLLRNITQTAPYLHDGSVDELDEVVRLMAVHQLGKEATDEQVHNIVAFLHTLNGDQPSVDIDALQLPAPRTSPNDQRDD